MKYFATILFLPLMLTFTSCYSDRDSVDDFFPTVSDDISEYQIEALSDGEITREEYDQGFQNYRSCMESIGFPLQGIEEVNLQYESWYFSEADDHGADDCFFGEFAKIQAGWGMRPEVAELTPDSAIIRECLLEHGIEPADNHVARVNQAIQHGIDIISECYQ